MASKKSKSSFDKMVKELDVIEQPLVSGKRTRNQTLFHSIGGSLVPTPPEHTFQERIKQEKDKEAGKAKQPRTKRQPNLPPGYSTGGASPPDVPPVLVPQFSVQNYSMPGPPYFYDRSMVPGDSSKPPEPVAYHVIPRPSKLLPYRVQASKSTEQPVQLAESKLTGNASKMTGKVRRPDETESDAESAVLSTEDKPVVSPVKDEKKLDDEVCSFFAPKMLLLDELSPGKGVAVTSDNLLDLIGLIQVVTNQSRHLSAQVLRRLIKSGSFDESKIISKHQDGKFITMYMYC